EWKRRVRPHDFSDLRELVLTRAHHFRSDVPVAEEHWADRNLLRVEKVGDNIVEIPRAARDVEDRIRVAAARSALERSIERGDPRKWQAGARILEEHEPRGANEARDLRLEHGVVHVADDAE